MLIDNRAPLLAGVALLAIVIGGALHAAGEGEAGDLVWRGAVALLAAELAVEVLRTVVVDRHLGVDTIALVAMVGALALGEELAGVVIGLMFSGGEALETVASRRARRELTALVQRAPKSAWVHVDGDLEEMAVERVEAGDVVLVRTGEVVPVDGTVVSDEAVVDTSTLSGEPLPVTVPAGMPVLSGSANAGAPFDVRADRPAAESAYSALVRLVEQAQRQRAPFVRMADRYAGFFLPATLLVAGAAWALSGDPVRGLAVVVVATPCPLILAAPIALVSGLSRVAAMERFTQDPDKKLQRRSTSSGQVSSRRSDQRPLTIWPGETLIAAATPAGLTARTSRYSGVSSAHTDQDRTKWTTTNFVPSAGSHSLSNKSLQRCWGLWCWREYRLTMEARFSCWARLANSVFQCSWRSRPVKSQSVTGWCSLRRTTVPSNGSSDKRCCTAKRPERK